MRELLWRHPRIFHIWSIGPALLWKHLFCSWVHKKHRCYPEVGVKDSKNWHCAKCHPCGESLDIYMIWQKYKIGPFSK